jgi:hypothetical protein
MSCVRGESAADEKEGEGVFIAAPQKLAVAEVLCVYRNFRHRVGTSDQFIFKQPRGFYRKLHRTSEVGGGVRTSDPTILTSRGSFVGQDAALPMGVGTSDPY